MGIIGRYIDHCCEHHPHLMRAVLERPLAPLDQWIDWDDEGRACGCLVGTCALVSGYRIGPRDQYDWPVQFVAGKIGWSIDAVEQTGIAVSNLSDCVGGDARAVHLMRQRIARQLAIRESRMAVASLPNEPAETVPTVSPSAGAPD